MRFFRTVLISIVVAAFLIPGAVAAGDAARIDPLLSLLADQQAKAGGQSFAPALERIIAVDWSKSDSDPRIGVILRLENGLPDLDTVSDLTVGSVAGSIATARLPLSSLSSLVAVEGIERIEAARRYYPVMDEAVPAGAVDQVWAGAPAYTGDGVLVGIIDSGIDWTHEDFESADGTTRIRAIWDLNGTGTPPAGFSSGAEYTSVQIDAGLVNQYDYNGHGTHVSGIAAGNGRASNGTYRGVAYESDILVAKAFDDAQGGFTGDQVIDAINYLVGKADGYDQPIAINLSLGGHAGAHDGTAGQEALIDALSGEGVVFVVAAGNEGSLQIHDSASAANGQVDFEIDSYSPSAGSQDVVVMEFWVEEATGVSITTPGGTTYGPVASGASAASFDTDDGAILVDNASSGADPHNGDRLVYIQIDDQGGDAPADGQWTIGFNGGSGTAHGWLAYASMAARFPDSDDAYSVGIPGTAEEAVTVAAWTTKKTWLSESGQVGIVAVIGDHSGFSSMGPTRDERQKPDISAPGQVIASCYSSDMTPTPDGAYLIPGGDYIVEQGTSMASPFVCGVAAMLLEKNGALTSQEIKAALTATADTDSYTGSTWNAAFGAGKIDAAAAIAAVAGSGDIPDGDLDLDGDTTVLDVVMLVNHILDDETYPLSPEAAANANVNGDGVIDALDLVRVVAFILGTDSPGKSENGPATFAVGAPVFADGRWWVEVTLAGESLAAGQFALRLPGAAWDADGAILVDGDVRVAARAAGVEGEQIRVLVYDLDNELTASGVTLQLPFATDAEQPAAPRLAGLLAAGPDGTEREVNVTETGALSPGGLVVAPNPSAGATNIRFSPSVAGTYSLSVYDLRGRRVRVLEQAAIAAQPVAIGWDGRDDAGRELPSGVYFVRVTAGLQTLTNKVVLSR